jgi:hypothetical protein
MVAKHRSLNTYRNAEHGAFAAFSTRDWRDCAASVTVTLL